MKKILVSTRTSDDVQDLIYAVIEIDEQLLSLIKNRIQIARQIGSNDEHFFKMSFFDQSLKFIKNSEKLENNIFKPNPDLYGIGLLSTLPDNFDLNEYEEEKVDLLIMNITKNFVNWEGYLDNSTTKIIVVCCLSEKNIEEILSS